MTALESDVKRLVVNAKQYNDKRSTVYEDAERLRKTASNFFTKHNPAYRNPSYVAIPTPIPGQSDEEAETEAARLSEMSLESPMKDSKANKEPETEPKEDQDAAEEGQDDDDQGEDFRGKTFQQAQEQIIEELIHYVDEEYVP
jgi:hypothetical protein